MANLATEAGRSLPNPMTDRLCYLAAAPFESARRVDVLRPGHRAARLHGHRYPVRHA